MGEIAEMMLDGTMCAGCGEFLGGGDLGIPEYCGGCSGASGGGYKPQMYFAADTPPNSRVRKKVVNHISNIDTAITFLNRHSPKDDVPIDVDVLEKQLRRLDGLVQRLRKKTADELTDNNDDLTRATAQLGKSAI